jgi:hypothetical protein
MDDTILKSAVLALGTNIELKNIIKTQHQMT